MNENNELNDIILNKGGATTNNKKIVLAVATLGVILIIVVMLMNSLTSSGTNNLPQAVLPPEPKLKSMPDIVDEPLFEDVEVVKEDLMNEDDLDLIARKLKMESIEEDDLEEEIIQIIEPIVVPKPKVVKKVKKIVYKEPKIKEVVKSKYYKQHYVQVGSFSKYKPNKKFLSLITKKGYNYKYHKVTIKSKVLNKVLVGPFDSEVKARKALKIIRRDIEAGAFILKI